MMTAKRQSQELSSLEIKLIKPQRSLKYSPEYKVKHRSGGKSVFLFYPFYKLSEMRKRDNMDALKEFADTFITKKKHGKLIHMDQEATGINNIYGRILIDKKPLSQLLNNLVRTYGTAKAIHLTGFLMALTIELDKTDTLNIKDLSKHMNFSYASTYNAIKALHEAGALIITGKDRK